MMNSPRKLPCKLNILALTLSALMAMPSQAWADNPSSENDLISLSLEELLNMNVTSVMKTTSRLSDAAAAAFVVTNDDIQRTGATSIPEALRIVPGMHVARVDGNKWAVSIRGFNGQFANKLLVLIDGRSVYTPLFAGVWWDQQDTMMEDIERIEVIRGPGASLWGANAVNGVINIITKHAKDTQGTLVSVHAGNERGGAGLRYGAKIGDDAFLKVYGHYSIHDGSPAFGENLDSSDLSRQQKVGFRFDKALTPGDKLMLQGDALSGLNGGVATILANQTANLTPVLVPPYNSAFSATQESLGYHLLGRWEHVFDNDSEMSLQFYWDHQERMLSGFKTTEYLDVFDVDFQHSISLTEQHKIVWGLGYRRNESEITNGVTVQFYPNKRLDDIYSLFAQDEITLVPEKWKLTLGSKLEHNPNTGYEVQPNARLLWTPNDKHSFWAAVSRAVRTPSWAEQNVSYGARTIPPSTSPNLSPFPLLITSQGNSQLDSEKMMAYELGWRGLVTPAVSADAALFYFDYDKAVTSAPQTPQLAGAFPAFYLRQILQLSNFAMIKSYGGELSLNWQVTEDWKLRANYSYARNDFTLKVNAPANTVSSYKNAYPQYQAMLWSMHQLTPKLKLDLNLRYVSNVNVQQAPGAYTALDARLAWKPRNNLELSLVGRNLLDGGHFEYGRDQFSEQTINPREAFVNLRWEF